MFMFAQLGSHYLNLCYIKVTKVETMFLSCVNYVLDASLEQVIPLLDAKDARCF